MAVLTPVKWGASMRMNAVTLIMLAVTRLIDSRARLTVDQLYESIRNGTVFDIVEQCLVEDPMLSGLPATLSIDERNEILEGLGAVANAVSPEDLGVANRDNGFLFLNALLIQMIQGDGENRIDIS